MDILDNFTLFKECMHEWRMIHKREVRSMFLCSRTQRWREQKEDWTVKMEKRAQMCRKTRAQKERDVGKIISMVCVLTSRAASEDQLTDFIIDKDEQGVGEGAEPPVGPGKDTQKEMRN